ncbi:MAG: hypothetical protein IKJ82_04230 [Oscillospiraceae bacterium]|nr:hypothetical protein [Oscillospiraceae bacterium]
MKRFFIAAMILAFVFSSCGAEKPEDIPPRNDEAEEIFFEKPEDFKEESIIAPEKPKKKDPPEENTSEYEEILQEEPKKKLLKDEEPMPEDIIRVDTETSDSEAVSAKQLEYIIAFLEPEKWEEAKDYEPQEKCFSGTVFSASNGGFIAVNFYGEKTFILKKWGENQEHRAYYYAPAKAAEFAKLFREKTEESAVFYDRWEDVSKPFPEFDEKLSYFGSGLNEDYDEENYISETPYFSMLFDHAYRLEKAAGRIGNDEYYPIYPADFVEELLGKYYLFSSREIKAMAGKYCYDPEKDTYNMESGYGGAYPMPRVTKIAENGKNLELWVDLHSAVDGYHITQSSVLTVQVNDDGSWKYLSNEIFFTKNYDDIH